MPAFQVTYSSLSTAALQQLIVKNYNLKPDSTLLFLKRGFNDTYLVSAGQEKFILRVYKHQWRKTANIESELELLLYLKKNNTSVSVPVPDIHNNYMQALEAPEGLRYAVLFSYAKGSPCRKLSVEQSFLLGKAAGHLHLLTKNKEVNATAQDYSVDIQFQHCLQILHPVLQAYPRQFHFLQNLRQSFLDEFKNIGDAVETGICHGDLQAENVHFTEDNLTFFDFDFFGKGYLIYDIGVFMWYDHKNKPPAILNSFLQGYESKRPLSEAERKLIPWMSTLRAIFQMTMYCELSDGKQLPLWPPQQVADFVDKVKKWHEAIR